MSKVLYRLYRPQSFDELIGQEHISIILKRSISLGKISHAYLFTGPRGLGKTSTARILAKGVNCLSPLPDGNPCNTCEICRSITNGIFFDLIEIDAASNRGIDQIRELKERVSYQPSQGKYKVYIIDEVHMLTNEAFNALLKTLEEPPSHVIFILATTEGYKLPMTIISRCQRYDFRLASEEKLQKLLKLVLAKENKNIEDEGVSIIVKQSKGSYRDALSLLEVILNGIDEELITTEQVRNLLGLPDNTMTYYFLENIFLNDYSKAISMLSEVYEKGVSLNQFVFALIDVLKKYIIEKTIKSDYKGEFAFLKSISDKKILRAIKLFVEAEREIKYSPLATLPLEIAILELCKEDELESQVKIVESKETTIVPKIKPKEENKNMEVDKISSDDVYDEGAEMSVEDIKKKWKELVSHIKKFNGHLYAFLNQARILSLKDGVLKLEVDYTFHKDRITSVQSKVAIQESFYKVYKIKPKIWCRVNKVTRPDVEVETNEVPLNVTNNSNIEELSKEVRDIFSELM